MTPELAEAIPGHLEKIGETMKPGGRGLLLQLHRRALRRRRDPARRRLRPAPRGKRKWDPEGRVVANHAVSLGEAEPRADSRRVDGD